MGELRYNKDFKLAVRSAGTSEGTSEGPRFL